MAIIFWICTILLALLAFVGYNGGTRYPWAYPGAFALIVIDLIIIGLHLFSGALH